MSSPRSQISRHAIDSRFLRETRKFWLYIPEDFDLDQPYPVLYAHDGEDYLTMGRIRTIANERYRDGTLKPIVIVGIPVDKKLRNAEYHPEGHRHRAYLSFVVEELIPYVENSVLQLRTKERATIGSSLGGVVGCQLAWNYPEKFQIVISQSGAFYSPSTTAALHNARHLDKTRYYFMVGTNERHVSTSMGTMDFLQANRKLRNLLEEKGTPFHYEEQEGEHTWGLWQKNLPDALAYFWSR